MPQFTDAVRWGAVALALPALAACSEYLDRRDTISVYGGDAVKGNAVAQMVDPWPPYAADRNIRYDGVVIGRAIARYHAGKVIPPRAIGTSSTYEGGSNSEQQSEIPQPGGAPVAAAAAVSH
jgi:hypothetical protein